MANWHIDEGLQKFIRQWKAKFPKATVYSIGDTSHSKDPDVSQHAPEKSGEVDAIDVMPGNGVTEQDLEDLFFGLHDHKDKRVLYVIYQKMLFSSTSSPWKIRTYNGNRHHHVHISVNDLFDNNQSDWHWEKMTQPNFEYTEVEIKLPTKLMYGMDDNDFGGWNHIGRTQALLNFLDNKLPDLDIDGVYGANTTQKVKAIFGGKCKILNLADIRKLHGV